MRVLVGCEFSGTVRDAFRRHGHDAWSCDVLPDDSGSLYHYECDIYGAMKSELKWDLIILHPPCTYLAVSGNRWYAGSRERHRAIDWTTKLWKQAKYAARRVCLEQPISVLSRYIKPTQYIQPWMFGHGETKKTTLYLHNLPKLEATDVVEGREPRVHYMSPSADRGKLRSVTYTGIADAMATQWGNL